MNKIRIINEKMVEKNIDLELAYAAIEQAYSDYSLGKTNTAQTVAMEVNDGVFYSFPCYIKGREVFISKQASDFRSNRKRFGLPTVHPYILVFDAHNGKLRFVVDGRHFAAIRTALSSAVGLKYLAKPGPWIVAILGSGVQAASHIEVFTKLFASIREIRVYSPTPEHRSRFVKKENKQINGLVKECTSAQEAVAKADILICVTNSKTPVFNPNDVKKGAFILGVGAMKGDQEIPVTTMRNAFIVVDAEENIEKYTEITLAKEDGAQLRIIGEIGTVVSKKNRFNSNGETVVFKHRGLPVTDAVLAEQILIKLGVL